MTFCWQAGDVRARAADVFAFDDYDALPPLEQRSKQRLFLPFRRPELGDSTFPSDSLTLGLH
jgi:hypothetical protein